MTAKRGKKPPAKRERPVPKKRRPKKPSPASPPRRRPAPPERDSSREGLLDALVAAIEDYAIFTLDPAGFIATWNVGAQRIKGYSAAEVVGKSYAMLFPTSRDGTTDGPEEILARARRDGRYEGEGWRRRKDGSLFWAHVVVTRILGGDGTIRGFAKVTRDATDVSHRAKDHTESQLRDSTALSEQIVRSVRAGIAIYDRETRCLVWNDFLADLTSRSSAEMIGRTFHDVATTTFGLAGDAAAIRALAGEATTLPDLVLRRGPRGAPIWIQLDFAPLVSSRGAITGVLSTARDVTERHRTNDALRESEERFHQLASAIREVFWLATPDRARVMYVSPAFEAVWGLPRHHLEQPGTWLASVHADDRAVLSAVIRRPHEVYDVQYRIQRPDGTTRWIRERGAPVRDARGDVVSVAGVADDVTDQRLLELQLRQAQKMEAVGQLAGGVAHDFNNLLTVISTNCDFLRDVVKDGDAAALVGEIRDAGARAATVTRQLLAFSRRQHLDLKIVDVNEVIRDTTRLLSRLLGEHIRLVMNLAPDAPRVRVDPGHLTQVLVNLAVNARDAMPKGGTVTLETSTTTLEGDYAATRVDLPAGRYLVIRVADDGEGMPPEVRVRVFEPFFTTKGMGRGTGLGLSVVHGIVKQSGGDIVVESELGVGTRFSVYLPASAVSGRPTTPAASVTRARGSGTILLVEDDGAVRRAARRMLESEGYLVVVARDGKHALEVYAELDTKVDLLLTDVVMPEIGGIALAAALRESQPDLRILYTSGYADDALVRDAISERGGGFLEKPYTREVLLERVRQALGVVTE